MNNNIVGRRRRGTGFGRGALFADDGCCYNISWDGDDDVADSGGGGGSSVLGVT